MLGNDHTSCFDRLNEAARQGMSAKRYLHVLGVTHAVTSLAGCHGLNVEAAAMAGMLHDISKELPCLQIEEELTVMGRPLTSEDAAHPKTWHGIHAAAIGPSRFGVTDPAVLRAVAQHTTGDADMGPLALALFVADFSEPGRSIDEAPEVRALAQTDLPAAYRRALDLKTRHMLAKPAFELHARTWRAIQHWLPERAREAPVRA